MYLQAGEVNDEEKFVERENRNIDGFNQAFGLCRFLLRLLGAWPDPYHDSFWTAVHVTFVVTTMFLFATVSQTVKMLLSLRDINVVIEIFVNCNIPTTIAMVKIISIWYHRDVLKDLLRQIINDWMSSRSDEEVTIMWKCARLSRFFTIGCIFLNKGTLITQGVANFLKPISHAVNADANHTEERPLYFIGSFPYDTQISPNYELSIFGQLLSNIFASFSFSSTDSFFYVLVFHVTGQLTILQLAIYNLSKRIEGKDCGESFVKKFSCIHKDHNRLWRFASAVEDCFNVMFLIQMIPCIFVMCTQGYLLIMITGAENVPIMDLIFMIYFLLLFMFTIFAYCFVAETLRKKSMEVSYAAYDCDWTTLSPKQAKLLILIVVRGQIPFELTAGKFAIFSLELYCSILKTSAGYLSMLLAVRDRMMEQSNLKITS